MTGSGGKVLSAFVEEVSPMRTHLRDDHWRPYVIPNKVKGSHRPVQTAHGTVVSGVLLAWHLKGCLG